MECYEIYIYKHTPLWIRKRRGCWGLVFATYDKAEASERLEAMLEEFGEGNLDWNFLR